MGKNMGTGNREDLVVSAGKREFTGEAESTPKKACSKKGR